MNAAYRLLLAGAEAAERAAAPENAALVYRTVSEQTNGEARNAALLGFLRCAMASGNAKLFEQALDNWGQATGDAFVSLHALVERLHRAGKHDAAMALVQREYGRTKSAESAFLLGLASEAQHQGPSAAESAFREAEVLAKTSALRDAARARRLAAAVKIPRHRYEALFERKSLAEDAKRSPMIQCLLAEVDLYASSRFRRAAALQELATLAAGRGSSRTREPRAEYALGFFLECRGDTLSALEQDRVDAFFAAQKKDAQPTLSAASRAPSRGAPSQALCLRAKEVLAGALPQAQPADTSMVALLLEFVAEAALPNGHPAPHAQTLLMKLDAGMPIVANYTFRHLEKIWQNPRIKEEGRERSVKVTQRLLRNPGSPDGGFLALLPHAPTALALDLALAARAADEPGADVALLQATRTLATETDLETRYRVLRDIRPSLGLM